MTAAKRMRPKPFCGDSPARRKLPTKFTSLPKVFISVMATKAAVAPGRMTLADIERIGKYLREIETDDKEMKKQFAELATLTSEFHPPEIPVGF